jgi:hypothetical protein
MILALFVSLIVVVNRFSLWRPEAHLFFVFCLLIGA